MPTSLWLLIWLNFRATFRRMGRQARTPKGIIFALLGVVVVLTWLVPVLFFSVPAKSTGAEAMRATAPVFILVFCALNVFASAGERAVTFSGPEVDFLFAGPFTRRQLLAYKLVKTGLGGTFSALIFGRILLRYGSSYWSGVVGIWLTFQFIQMVAMVAALLQTTIGERVFTHGRRWLLVALIAVVVAAVGPLAWREHDLSPITLSRELGSSTLGRCLLAPFNVFARAVTADRFFPDALPWDAAAIAIDAALIGVVLQLDTNYLETAATASAKRYARVSRVRKMGLAGTANAGAAKLRVPPLPRLGGAGPVAWRQLTGVLRTGRGLLVVVAIVAFAGGGTVAHADRDPQSVLSLVLVSVGINLFLSSLLKFDFRGDLEHLDVLRSLPVRPTAVAAGEIIAPTLVLSCVQGLLLIAAAVWGHVPTSWLLGAAVFVVPINAVLVGTENLLFLLFPSEQTSAVAGDMGMVGRRSIVLMCRLIVLLLVAAICIGLGAGVWMVSGHSVIAAAGAAWVPLPCAIVAVVLLLGLVYERFDRAVDGPM